VNKGRGNVQAINGDGHYMLYMRDVYHSYGNKTVMGNVDLAMKKGELCTMVGPSGCGKSTLLRLLTGEEIANSGVVKIDGKVRTRPNSDCGIVYQKYSLFPHLSVLDNVATGLIFTSGTSKKRAYEKARNLLSVMGLEKEEKKYPHQLSGGMQQRVAISQAVITHPKVLLLDEPFSALDPWTREQLQQFLVGVWMKEQMTIIFVTHDIEEAIFLGTRIVVLSQQYATASGKARGARIVADLPISQPHPRPLEFKTSQELNSLLLDIRQIAFERKEDGSKMLFISDFLLKHEDSFQVCPAAEWGDTGNKLTECK
jgi:NitT/TauT family transport system ATP-binding protein